MATTLQQTLNWTLPVIRFMPLTIGTANEPAITNANCIQQTILSAPFAWNWNRAAVTFNTVVGQQDYTQAVPTFGYMEKAVVTYNGIKEITIKESLSQDSAPGRPDFIAAEVDDNAGNITFRLMKVPDQVCAVTVTFQKKAVPFALLTDSWMIPDQYSHIYNYGFLALGLMHADDPRFPVFNQKFMSALLAVSTGLSETERNIFIGSWLALTRQETNEAIKTQQGNQVRVV